VVNDTRVLPARVPGYKKDTGGKVEVLFVQPEDARTWRVMLKSSRRPAPGQVLSIGVQSVVDMVFVEDLESGLCRIRLPEGCDLLSFLEAEGDMPLPPYIVKARGAETQQAQDQDRYQTVYAREPGAVAAPTAGLHFTPEILEALKIKGVQVVPLTLHVGPGTFQPVKAERVGDHVMHFERYELSESACIELKETRKNGGRICCVGTTCVRTLEAVANKHGELRPDIGETDTFITPGWDFKAVDGLLTNFHLPRSTLLMLVSAFGGYEKVMNAYRIAIENQYRFYSYGDCMLVI